MKSVILIALAACSIPVLADQPYQHTYVNGGYWDGQASSAQNSTSTPSDVERAQAAIVAGQDPTEVLGATAAGNKPYARHPYLNAGHFGERIHGDRE